MLYTETVERGTLALLKTLMQDEKLTHFILAGGTALALYLGHRKSIDLDLFSPDSFDAKELQTHLLEKYNFETYDVRERNTLRGFIDNIKVEFITHAYPLLASAVISEDNIRMYNVKDIAAMKLLAIADNGTRLKDFVDVAYLSMKMPLSEMLLSFEEKYKNTASIFALKGLSYFSDIDFNVVIDLIDADFNWGKIEQRILDMIKNEDNVFELRPI